MILLGFGDDPTTATPDGGTVNPGSSASDTPKIPQPMPVPPAGHCGGATPGWYCPQYADRNAMIGAAAGILIGAGLKGSRAASMMAGATFFGLVTWYFFSGRWWR